VHYHWVLDLEIIFFQVIRPIGHNFFLNEFNSSCIDEIHGIFIDAVGDAVNDPGYTGIDQNFGAINTGEVGDITSGAARGYSMQGGLDDRICFCVDGANAVPINDQMPDFVTMLLTRR
jgi:hypothetical protein